MRKIVAAEYISLDGVVEAGWGGHRPALSPTDELTSRYFNDPAVGGVVGALTADGDTMLLGRATYQGFAAFFAGQTGGMADQMNAMPKIVVSSTLEKAEWQNSTVLNADAADRITALKQQPGKNINVSGSATLVRWLLRQGLLDELHLLVFPVVMGSGVRLFVDGMAPTDLGPATARPLDCGVVHLTYQPTV